MKTVIPTDQVAHLFAHQSQDYATTPTRNFYFTGNKCNSYGSHFTAAVHHGETVLLNNDNYSSTTSKHMGALRAACSHLTTFHVQDPDANSKPDHRANFSVMVREYETEVLRASRARIWNSTDHAERLLNTANEYAAWSKIGNRLQPIALDQARAAAANRSLKDKLAAKRASKTRAKAQAKIQAERVRKEQENARCWRDGTYFHSLYNLPVMLRLSSDGSEVQTSHGARFPAKDARRWIGFVISLFNKGEDWERNGSQIELGAFQLDKIRGSIPEQYLKAGCHIVTADEVRHLAALLVADKSVAA